MTFNEANLSKGGTTLEERKEVVRRFFNRAKENCCSSTNSLIALVEGDQVTLDKLRARCTQLDKFIQKHHAELDAAASDKEQAAIIGAVQIPEEIE